MREPGLEELHRLVASPEPPRRLHGFLRLEEHLAELPLEGGGKLVDLAAADPDPNVVAVGRRLREALEQERTRRAFPRGGRSVLAIDGDALEEEVAMLGGTPPRPYGLAADHVLGGCVAALADLLAGAPPSVLGPAIQAAGALRHPGLLEALEARGEAPELAPIVARALAGWSGSRVLGLLRRLAARSGPGRVGALEALAESAAPPPLDLFLAAASDPDPAVRRAAALGLGAHGAPGATAAIRELLEDPSLEVQRAAVRAWGRHAAPDASEVLLEKLKFSSEDPDLRARVVTELRVLRSPEVEKALELLLADRDQRVRANAIEALGGYEHTPSQATRLFRKHTQEGSARVRGNAVLSLSLAAPPAATEALLELFDTYEAPVRRAAAYCAGMIQSARATERLALMMRTEQDQDVLSTGIRALARIRGPRAIEILQDFAARKSYGAVGVAAIDLLADLGQASAVPTLTQLARASEDPAVRAAAGRAIARLAAHQGLSHLPRLLADSADEVVITAIEGLEHTGSLEAIGLLTPLLGHARPPIRAAAVTALWHLGDFPALGALEEQLRSPDEAHARAGLLALGRVGESLRVARLGRRPVLGHALYEAFRRGFPDEARTLRPPEPPPAAPRPAAASDAPEPDGGPDPAPDPAGPGSPGPGSDATAATATPASPADPADLEALRLLEAGYDQAGRPPQEALEALSRSPRSAALLQVALRQVLAARETERLPNLERMVTRQDDFYLTPRAVLSQFADRRGDSEAAVTLRLEAAARQIETATRLLEEAREALDRGGVNDALGATRLLAGLLRSPPRLHQALGDHAEARGRHDEARAEYLKAFLAFPGEAGLALKVATAAARAGDLEMARTAAKAAYRRDPDGLDGGRARALLSRLKDPEAPAPS